MRHKIGTGDCESCDAENVTLFASPRWIRSVCAACFEIDQAMAVAGDRTIAGRVAIEYARLHGLTLSKHADPTEGPRDGLSVEEAEAIASEDPSLIYLPERRER